MLPEPVSRWILGGMRAFRGILEGVLRNWVAAENLLAGILGVPRPPSVEELLPLQERIAFYRRFTAGIVGPEHAEDAMRVYHRVQRQFAAVRKYSEDEFPYDAFVETEHELPREFRVIVRIDYVDAYGERQRAWLTLDFDEPKSIRELKERALGVLYEDVPEYTNDRGISYVERVELEEFWRRRRRW